MKPVSDIIRQAAEELQVDGYGRITREQVRAKIKDYLGKTREFVDKALKEAGEDKYEDARVSAQNAAHLITKNGVLEALFEAEIGAGE